MDACIAENDEQLANEIGDLLLSKNLSLVHEAKGSPVFFLVYLLGCKNSLQRMQSWQNEGSFRGMLKM